MVYLSYSNPLIIMYSMCVFAFFLNMKVRNISFINSVARHTFATYLLTDYFLGPLFLYKYLCEGYKYNFGFGLLLSILVYCAAILIDYMRSFLSVPLENLITRKLERVKKPS